MNAYEHYSNSERQQLEKIYRALNITTYTFTSSAGFDKVEGTFTLGGNNYVVEAKCRACGVNFYPSHLLEKPKYDELKRWQSDGFTPLYINFFRDGAIVYNLKKRDTITFTGVELPKNTAGGGDFITKRVAYLEFDASLGDKRFVLKSK